MNADLPEATAECKDGFVDLVFSAESTSIAAGGEFSVTALAVHDGKEVGFRATLDSKWHAQPGEGFIVYWGKVRLSPCGTMSDRLVGLLDQLYQIGCGASRMHDTGELTAASLGDDPRNVQSSRVHLKLFINEDEDDERYAEIYLNVDLPRKRVELCEKDESYRRPLVLAFSDAG